MKTVNVQKAALIEVVTKNRAAHRDLFEKAVEGYKREAVRQLERMLADVKVGKRIQVAIQLQMPQDQTKDYDRVLTMLDMSVDDVIPLDSTAFANYVMDDWSWSQQTTALNTMYANS
jgi:hypothetical protein